MKLFKRTVPADSSRRWQRTKLSLEQLELRRLLTTFQVTNTSDSGEGSLRSAIENANVNPGKDTISFALPGDAGATQMIELQSVLPNIVDPLVIDGTSQAGYAGTPLVEISGLSHSVSTGLNLLPDAEGSEVRGLAITGFTGSGIRDVSRGSTLFEHNYIGIKPDGVTPAGNATGIAIESPLGTTGTSRAIVQHNVSSGNQSAGIAIVATTNVLVHSNFLGTDATGSVPVANQYGITINSSSDLLIGGEQALGNVISGNRSYGIGIGGFDADSSEPVLVSGNLIGTDASGTLPIANGVGIDLNSAQNVRIGVDTLASERNVISGNLQQGIVLRGSLTTDNIIAGNFIGTTLTGNAELPNAFEGVAVNLGAHENVIGTDGDGVDDGIEGNVIAGNGRSQIEIKSEGTDENIVAGNLIGLGADSSTILASSYASVTVSFDAEKNRIGTDGDGQSDDLEGNTIVGDGLFAVQALIRAHETTIAGNTIGRLNAGGDGSTYIGIDVRDSNNVRIGTDNTGQPDHNEANTIIHNRDFGVRVLGESKGVKIRGNAIHSNGLLAIALGSSAPNPNDGLDTDAGPNGLQNHPIVASADGRNALNLSGSFSGEPSQQFVLDFYASTASPASQAHVGSTTINTDENGMASYDVAFPVLPIIGQSVTATATAANGSTSEFSPGVIVSSSNVPPTADLTVLDVVQSTDLATVNIAMVNAEDEAELSSLRYSFALSESALATTYNDASTNSDASFIFQAATTATLFGRVIDSQGAYATQALHVQVGTNSEDTLLSGDGPSLLIGLGKADQLLGGSSSDFLFGGPGRDQLFPGLGIDIVDGGASDDVIHLAGSDSAGDTLVGGSGYDRLINIEANTNFVLDQFSHDANTIELIDAAGGAITGNEGDNTLNFIGVRLNNVSHVAGLAGNDIIDASSITHDVLYLGNDGDDLLRGNSRRDILDGGQGNNTLHGGGARDTFRLSPNIGRSQIQDFRAVGSDKIDITGYAFADWDAFIAAVSWAAADVDGDGLNDDLQLTLPDGLAIDLVDVALDDLNSGDFQF